jgi:hypothetical protein
MNEDLPIRRTSIDIIKAASNGADIIISNPTLNVAFERRFGLIGPGEFREDVLLFDKCGLSPEEYPKVCDLSSGDGTMALFLTQQGWKPNTITCIDYYRPNPSLVDGVSWAFMDLLALCCALEQNKQLPAEVERFRGNFDIVTHIYGYFTTEDEMRINRFFVRDGGFIFGAGRAPNQKHTPADLDIFNIYYEKDIRCERYKEYLKKNPQGNIT